MARKSRKADDVAAAEVEPVPAGLTLRTLGPVDVDEYDPLVAVAQAAIVHVHGLTTAVDGRFRRDTEARVREIQGRVGLDPSGRVDADTWRVLLAAG